jgi:hypothetical protein
VVLCWVGVFAKVTNPFLPLVHKLDKRIYVCATVFASNDGFVTKTCCRDLFSRGQLSVGLNGDSKRNAAVFGELRIGGNAVSGQSEE